MVSAKKRLDKVLRALLPAFASGALLLSTQQISQAALPPFAQRLAAMRAILDSSDVIPALRAQSEDNR